MSARAFLAELDAAGVRLTLAGDDLRYQTRPGVSIAPYRDRIASLKPALVVELLQAAIVAAATVEPGQFDRSRYDQLWAQWRALDAEYRDAG